MRTFVKIYSEVLMEYIKGKCGLTAAANEPPVKAEELMEEIFPLLQDYFIGEISLDGDGIVYKLPNGQIFRITAKTE